jgi:hypothetical protein
MNTSKKSIYAGLALLALGLISTSEVTESIATQYRKLIGDEGQICFDSKLETLKDPFSAKYTGSKVDLENPSAIHITYYAKNSYGAYVPEHGLCVIKNGKVDADKTKFKELMDSLDLQINCLKKRNQLYEEGRRTDAARIQCDES